jgi:hydrogenase nickel incorporation protein HypA/HybF
MHEAALMQNILDLALEKAREAKAQKIHTITLRIGALAGVEPEALRFAFECTAGGTMAEQARLEVESVPVVCYCEICAREFEPLGPLFACPNCGELRTHLRRGNELELAALEIS